jgi:hypothetical protein
VNTPIIMPRPLQSGLEAATRATLAMLLANAIVERYDDAQCCGSLHNERPRPRPQ